MGKDLSLIEKRNQIKGQMSGYRSLPEYILDGMGAIFERLFNPAAAKARATFLPADASNQENEGFPSYWLNGMAIAFVTFLVGWIISAVMGHPLVMQGALSENEKRLILEELKLILWAAGTGALALIANKVNIRIFLNTFRESSVDKMLRVDDLENLEKWLHDNFQLQKPLVSGLVIGPLLGWFLYNTWLTNHDGSTFQIGLFVTVVLSCIQSVWVGYYLYPFYVAFPSRLNHYHFDLYTPDPSSSEVVGQLSRLLTFILYVTIGYIVQLTIGLGYVNVLTTESPAPGLIFSVFVWAPTVILYSAGQFHLSNLITGAKWKMLNEVQTKIEELYREEKIPDKDTLDRLEKLMNYHDRIKSTPNSALNFRASLNFLNSLLLPVLAFVVANIRDVFDLFRK